MGVVDIFVNVSEAMGANIINTIAEYIAPKLEDITGARLGIKILSNLCVNRKAYSSFTIPIKEMSWKNVPGEVVA